MASNDRQDKLLMETCIKHLIQYAATIKISRGIQEDESIGRLGKVIGKMEAYWNLSDKRGRVEQFSKTLRCAVQTGRTNGVSKEQKIVAMNGSCRYVSEVIFTQGVEAADWIKKVQSVIRELADGWGVDKEQAAHLCSIVGTTVGNKEQQPSGTREESRFSKNISTVAEKMGFEVKGVKNGLLQLYLGGSCVVQVDENGSLLYHPYSEMLELMDAIEAWEGKEENLQVQDEPQM